jgi:hypothetical protein
LSRLARELNGLELNGLNDTHGDGTVAVADGKAAKGRVSGVGLAGEGLSGDHANYGAVTADQGVGGGLSRLASLLVELGDKLGKLDGQVARVAIHNGGVASTDFARVLEDNNLGGERHDLAWRRVLELTYNVTLVDIGDSETTDTKSNVVPRESLGNLGLVHFNSADFSSLASRSESDGHSGLKNTRLYATDRHSSNTTNLVHVLDRDTERLVDRADGLVDIVKSVDESRARVPLDVVGLGLKVITGPSSNRNEVDQLGLIANLFNDLSDLSANLLKSLAGPVAGIHLVYSYDKLSHTESVREENMLAGGSSFFNSSLELSLASAYHEKGHVGLSWK